MFQFGEFSKYNSFKSKVEYNNTFNTTKVWFQVRSTKFMCFGYILISLKK